MAMLVFVEVSSFTLEQHSINSTGGGAFGIVECKIPTITASAGSGDPDIARVVDMEESVTVTLVEFTCLLRTFYDTVRKIMHVLCESKTSISSQEIPEKSPKNPSGHLSF